MRRKFFTYLFAALLLTACNAQRPANDSEGPTYTDTVANNLADAPKPLETTLTMADTLTLGTPLTLKFVVRNPADSIQKFCKWHTPFEPFLNNYLDIKDSEGKTVSYKGAMAKRVMPPPPETYLEVAAHDSVSTTVDLMQGYTFDKTGIYHMQYQGQNLSGLTIVNDLTFVLKN